MFIKKSALFFSTAMRMLKGHVSVTPSHSPHLRFHFLDLLRQFPLAFLLRRAVHIITHALAIHSRRVPPLPAVRRQLLHISSQSKYTLACDHMSMTFHLIIYFSLLLPFFNHIMFFMGLNQSEILCTSSLFCKYQGGRLLYRLLLAHYF